MAIATIHATPAIRHAASATNGSRAMPKRTSAIAVPTLAAATSRSGPNRSFKLGMCERAAYRAQADRTE